MTGATCGLGSAYPSRTPGITSSFWWGSCCLFFSFFMLCLCYFTKSIFRYIHKKYLHNNCFTEINHSSGMTFGILLLSSQKRIAVKWPHTTFLFLVFGQYFLKCYGVVNLFSIYEFDSGIFRPSFKVTTAVDWISILPLKRTK